MTSRLLIGTASVDITPPVGVYLAGFGARTGPSTGLHDHLLAAAWVADDGERQVAIVTTDLIGVPAGLVREVRDAVAAKTELPPSGIMISASHTHSGPDISRPDDLTQGYRKSLIEKLVSVTLRAWQERRPATVRAATGELHSTAANRRPNGGPIDRSVNVLSASSAGGQLVGVLVNYTCHGTVLGPDNLLISADYIGYMRRHLAEQLGEGVVLLFANGALGNINPGGYSPEVSMVGGNIPNRTYAHAEELGTRLADAVLALLSGTKPSPGDACVGSTQAPARLPLKERPPVAEAEAELASREAALAELQSKSSSQDEIGAAQIALAYARMALAWAKAPTPTGPGLDAEVQALCIGDARFVGIPGEAFNEIGTAIKHDSGLPFVFVIGLANASLGYFPTADAYAVGGYEPTASKVKPGADLIIVQTALELLRKLPAG